MPTREPPGSSRSACRIPEIGLTCVGCCLYAFAGKEPTLAAISCNPDAFSRIAPGDEGAVLRFRDRAAPADVVCCNCVEEAPGVLGCALHPARHGSRDLRRGHCLAEFLCRTAALYRTEWDGSTRERFAAFVGAQRLDNYEFSRRMVTDELLEAFVEDERAWGETPPAPGA
jgi:hypothetical protein